MTVDEGSKTPSESRLQAYLRRQPDLSYSGCTDDYDKAMFGRAEFEELAALLKNLKGRFVMSINDMPEIRGLFAGFPLQSVELTCTVAGGKNAKPAKELITT